jgi:hypothetical protein
MADLKISALPAASVALAGTEVLPIVQSSATKQVTVANLTAGRAVSALSLALTGSPLPVASGGTNASSASITAFNNITGYSAVGATGTTSTNLVFSVSPLITTPTINSTGAQIAIFNGYQSTIQNTAYQHDGRNYIATTSGTLTKFASATINASTPMGRIIIDVIVSNTDANSGYAIARSQRVILFSKFGGTTTILNSTEQFNQIGSVNAGVISIALVTSAAVSGSDIDLKATATATGAVGATNLSITSQVTVITGAVANSLTMV